MKTFARFPLFALALMLALGLVSSPALDAEPPTLADLTGSTWELVAHKSGDAKEWENAPAGSRKIKILTATHFVWIDYEANSGKVRGSGGGTYTVIGDAYTEMVEFGGGNVADLRAEKQVFTLDLKGDRLEQTGQLSNGFKIAEVWQRVH